MNVKCKSKVTREKALRLLGILIKDDPKAVILVMIKGFLPLSKCLPEITQE